MHYEVEQKFRVDDVERLRAALIAIGAASQGTVEQVDCYYRHPMRDFAATDEAFRLRRVGARNFMTYKGPKIDATTKTRVEEEVRLADGDAAFRSCDEILRRLGFEPAATVRKRRETLMLSRGASVVEAALDDVAGVGTFLELEVGVEAASGDASAVEAARRLLAELAGELGLGAAERRSYLELLLAPGDRF